MRVGKELDPLILCIRAHGQTVKPLAAGRLSAVLAPALGTIFAVGGHGKVQLALQTQHLIDLYPGLTTIIRTGAAGMLSTRLQFGDVVVGTTTIEHDYKLRFLKAPLPRWPADESILLALRHLSEGHQSAYRLHFGAIASGDEDVIDRNRAEELFQETGALCVDWEGAGAARVAAFNKLRFLEIRVITDGADADAAVTFPQNLKTVMPHIRSLLVSLRGGSPKT